MVMNSGYLKLAALTLGVTLSYSSLSSAVPSGQTPGSQDIIAKTSLVLHGEAKYGSPDQPFTHFEYVNPDAPKGGSLRMAASGTFDSLNPYTNKGTPVTGIGLIYDTLMTQSRDEPFSLYPLVAESAEKAPDNSSITYNLNPDARFHDGKPITANDVKYTFELLTSQGHPFYRSYYSDVDSVTVLSDSRVKFTFKHANNRELPFILSELPILPQHHWEQDENDFSSTSLNIPLGSGPYQVKHVDGGRSIAYQRVSDYWAKDLPVNKGRYNFDEISYDYYRDEHVALQALKAGEYDLRHENIAKNWATAYDVPAVHRGELILATIPTRNPAPIQGFAFNLRRDFFQDPLVRKAMGYAMDFEWLNRNLFHDSHLRSKSYFGNSGMEASGIPEGDELTLLEPWRSQLPADLFTKPYSVPVTNGSGNIRPQLQEALTLLKKAGWRLENNKLVDKRGQPLEVELLLAQPSLERVALLFKKNLEQMGIELNIRTVDISQYINRIRDFDYDMIVAGYGQSASPGNEQTGFWGSKAADTKGSRNYMGIKDPVVDAMIDHVINADSREELTTAVKALDRVLLWGEYMIPQWYYPYDRIAHSNKLARPKSEPLYSTDIYSWWIDSQPDATKATSTSSPSNDDTEAPAVQAENDRLWLYSGLILLGLIPVWIYRRRKNR
ncbi:extracellular solute-binding protein [Endozoicomonas sp. SCSIO W0465]|uniref:extracellular solute-binding protein n=1 Tax=Endozoicomonas sp. SCSIO W0465 TaxID=2918516 RepID=UPI002074CED7|nr:extracellular solute-binding protein [Endozoicomonas sp. SCSIO W0465]USE39493.1 extracellular solute-binding protein [Endozoicomonas sp. SCSIO W0465]